MCGIAGLLLSPQDLQRVSVDEMVKTLALEIESRGKDATGVARLTASNRMRLAKAPRKASEFFLQHPQIADGCRLVLVHTRQWTLGDPKNNANNHPIMCGPIHGVHNGVVSNHAALYDRYKWDRIAEVDSEAIFAALHHLDAKEALELLSGSIACAWHDQRKPGHLFLARHTSSPLNVGISDTGSVVFASTNNAVAKAMAALGASKVEIDPLKEGVMCEFWIDDDKLMSEITEFEPPRTYYRQGSWEYTGTGALPRGRHFPPAASGTKAPATQAPQTPSYATGWGLGANGWVLRTGDEVVFEPTDVSYEPMYGTVSHFGAKQGMVFVEFEFDWGLSEEVHLPINRLWPVAEWKRSLTRTPKADSHLRLVPDPIALPPVRVESEIDGLAEPYQDNGGKQPDDFYMPKSTQELVDAIEDIFGAEALDLIPGYYEWERGEITGWELTDDGELDPTDDVIDVEEAY